MHCCFGFGVVFVNPALEALGRDPPRFCGTAFQNAWLNPIMWSAFMGWTGVDQYDEGNTVGQKFRRVQRSLRPAPGMVCARGQ